MARTELKCESCDFLHDTSQMATPNYCKGCIQSVVAQLQSKMQALDADCKILTVRPTLAEFNLLKAENKDLKATIKDKITDAANALCKSQTERMIALQAQLDKAKEQHRDYDRLYEITNEGECKCDTGPPWNNCIRCMAAHALNECGEIESIALQNIEQALAKAQDEEGRAEK